MIDRGEQRLLWIGLAANALVSSGVILFLGFRLIDVALSENVALSLVSVAGDGDLLLANAPLAGLNVLNFTLSMIDARGSVEPGPVSVAGVVINLGLLATSSYAVGLASGTTDVSSEAMAFISLLIMLGTVAGTIASAILMARRTRSADRGATDDGPPSP